MIRVVFLLAGCVLFAYLTSLLGPGQIIELLAQIGPNVLAVAVIYAGYQVCRAAALSRCLPEDAGRSFRDVLGIRISGEAVQFLTFTGPFLAEPTKMWLLRRRGLGTREAVAATVTEYLIYTFTSAALSIAGLMYLLDTFELDRALSIAAQIILLAMALFLLVSMVAIVFRIYLIGAIVQGVARLPKVRDRVRPDMDWVHRMEDLLLEVLRDHPARLLRIVIAELMAQALLIFEIYWILTTLDLEIGAAYPFLVEAATKFTSLAFFFIPTQMGAAEAVYALVFDALGLATAAGFTLALVRRVRSLLVAGAGLATLWLLTRRTAEP